MLISKKLLESINPKFKDFSNNDFINAFNKIGCEVETIEKIQAVQGLVLGKVIEIKKIEDSDHLNICKVQVKDELLQIVCGAKNVKENAWVVVAKVGTKFSEEIVILERKLRGIVSQGMLCAYAEIVPTSINNLSKTEKESIILIDDKDINFDSNVYEYLNLEDEVIELSIPSNRNDLNGILSIVNELNYAFELNFSFIEKVIKTPNQSSEFKINFDDDTKKLIDSYLFGTIELKKEYKKTDWKIKTILLNSNVFVTDTIADIANYITLLTAQPIHFYDYDKLDKELNFSILKKDEIIESINEVKTELKKGTLVSKSNNIISAAIGLIGANYCKVTNKTKKVLFEVININNTYISRISKENNISTNASILFSKKLSSFFISKVYYYLCNFFNKSIKIISSNIIDNKKIFKFKPEIINGILGTNLSNHEIYLALSKGGFSIKFGNVIVPKHRIDIESNQDLSEEVLKSLDINSFAPEPIQSIYSINQPNLELDLIDDISNYLVSKGLFEVKTQNLTSKENVDKFNYYDLEPFVLFNPMNSQKSHFRTSLQPQMLDIISNNIKRKNPLFNFFEIQKIYGKNKIINLLTIFVVKPFDFNANSKNLFNYEEATYLLDSLLTKLNVNYELKNLENYDKQILSNCKNIGRLFKIDSENLRKQNVEKIYCIELDINELLVNKGQFVYKKLNLLNPIYRQITFYNKEDNDVRLYFNELEKIDLISEVNLINVYSSDSKKTYTIKIKIDNEENLTNDQITKIFDKAISLLSKYNLELDNKKE